MGHFYFYFFYFSFSLFDHHVILDYVLVTPYLYVGHITCILFRLNIVCYGGLGAVRPLSRPLALAGQP